MSISGIVFGILAIFVFAFDLILGFPFACPSPTLDIAFIFSGFLLTYLGWSAMRSAR